LTLVLLPAGYHYSHGDRKWLAVALNVLTFVSELVSEVGRLARLRVVRVGDFSVVEVSHRASLVRDRTWSMHSVRGFGSFRLRGRSLWRGFLRGLSFLIVNYGYPLFRYPTTINQMVLSICPCVKVKITYNFKPKIFYVHIHNKI
jgi:hypothetical protein